MSNEEHRQPRPTATAASQITYALRRKDAAIEELDTQGYHVTLTDKPGLCVNARSGYTYWYCHHFNGRVTPGTELTDNNTRCAACQVADTDNPPSWMRNEDET